MLTPEKKSTVAKGIANIIGDEYVSVNETDAILNSIDAWPLSAAKVRAGEVLALADIIAFPETAEED